MIDVLVVDDDFMVARIHTGFVERVDGFRVVGSCHTGASALEAVERLQPDLVLLDLYLPDMFGLDVLAALRTAGQDCDVMVITAAKEVDSVRGAMRRGVVDYVLKPFGFDDLRQRLERYAVQQDLLHVAEVSGQADIDKVLARRPSTAGPEDERLPKGLSPETAQLVASSLRSSGGTLSATECAEAVGLSRVSARRYLEHLVRTGQARVALRYGSTGRPERRYRWAG